MNYAAINKTVSSPQYSKLAMNTVATSPDLFVRRRSTNSHLSARIRGAKSLPPTGENLGGADAPRRAWTRPSWPPLLQLYARQHVRPRSRGASAAACAGGGSPCGSGSRVRLDTGLLVYRSWRLLGVDRRPLRRCAKTSRRLGGRTLDQTWPGLRLDRWPLALGFLRFGPMPFYPNRTTSFDLSLRRDDLLSSPIGTTKRIADNHVFPADEVGCGIETLRQRVPRRVAVKNNGRRRNRL